ncbi:MULTISPECIES: DUF4429 domain-containing protein [Streptomyces]|nr:MULTISPECIES: DUF4429 domain-containing protein [Streptomyces]NEE33313.1 DUF4429 domain-containing protein [Streptomyces sp. SID7982]NEE54274.1 DUF4429 domain-containing protein [Streptomyces sp. SID8455]MDQ0295766.1 hypothetical protein [Streptomyces sp. DSM 41037]NEC12516.1 DUF4429 domain-containing protein [Streptomyces sp. SID8014]PJM85669.1 hypothetical protein CH313_04350 [Streptomyces sp. TSRI0384-2]
MGDVLAGSHAAWEVDSDSVLIRFERGIRTPKLFQALGERRIPLEALETVSLAPGRRGTVVLRAVARAGADPLMDAASGQLKEGCDPYRLVLPSTQEQHAREHVDELNKLIADRPAPACVRGLVAPPEAPLHFKAYDGKASFDGAAVSFRWSPTGASTEKWKAGDQTFPVAELADVEWRSPEVFDGCLRLIPRSGPAAQPARPELDPTCVVFGPGYGPVHESLPFAAAVLAAVRAAERTPESRPAESSRIPLRRDPADIAERIRHLGELHQAGLVTDEEFVSKKTQLLSEL